MPPAVSTCLATAQILVNIIGRPVLIPLDIRGANEYGWYSILVRTGNFKGDGNSEKYPAKRVFDDVEQAVHWILGHEDRRYQNLLAARESGGVADEKDEGYYTAE